MLPTHRYPLLVPELRVIPRGLEAWSTQCGTVAGELAANSVTPPSLTSGQATATAVSTGQTLIGGTATVLASRVQATGKSAAASAATYATNDEESAERLAALTPAPVVG